MFQGEASPSTVDMICLESKDSCKSESKCNNYCDSTNGCKEVDDHEEIKMMIMMISVMMAMVNRERMVS